MEDKIIKILQSFRLIEPDSEFKKRSQALIFALPKHKTNQLKIGIFDSAKFAAAISFATILLFIVIGGLSYFKITNISPELLGGFNEQNLLSEAAKLNFEIQLGEVKYFDKSAEQVAAVLKEISQVKEGEDLEKLIDEIFLNKI